jgi:hypothetical protein
VTFGPGRMHDQTALQTDGVDDLLARFPGVQAEVDAGYRGLRCDHPASRRESPARARPPEAARAWVQARHTQSSRRSA